MGVGVRIWANGGDECEGRVGLFWHFVLQLPLISNKVLTSTAIVWE